MRHGRKSSAKTFNGFKEHFAVDLDSKVTREVVVRPANEPEHEAVELLAEELEKAPGLLQLAIDLGYMASPRIAQWAEQGVYIIARSLPQLPLSLFPLSSPVVVDRTVGDSEGAQTPWDTHKAACQKGVMKGFWRGVKVETSTRARPRSPPAHYVTSKKSSRRRTGFGISSLQQASPLVGHNRCFITPGDTPMHLFLAMIAFAGVVGVLYGLVILLRGRSLSE